MRDETELLVTNVEPTVNKRHWEGSVEAEEYWYNDCDPSVVLIVTGPFARLDGIIKYIRDSQDWTIDYVAHKHEHGVETRIGVDYHGSLDGTLFTDEI